MRVSRRTGSRAVAAGIAVIALAAASATSAAAKQRHGGHGGGGLTVTKAAFGELSVLHRPMWLYGTPHISIGSWCLLMHSAWLAVERSAWDAGCRADLPNPEHR